MVSPIIYISKPKGPNVAHTKKKTMVPQGIESALRETRSTIAFLWGKCNKLFHCPSKLSYICVPQKLHQWKENQSKWIFITFIEGSLKYSSSQSGNLDKKLGWVAGGPTYSVHLRAITESNNDQIWKAKICGIIILSSSAGKDWF